MRKPACWGQERCRLTPDWQRGTQALGLPGPAHSQPQPGQLTPGPLSSLTHSLSLALRCPVSCPDPAARLTHQHHRHSILQHHPLHREPLVVQGGDWAGQGHVQAPSAGRGDPVLRQALLRGEARSLYPLCELLSLQFPPTSSPSRVVPGSVARGGPQSCPQSTERERSPSLRILTDPKESIKMPVLRGLLPHHPTPCSWEALGKRRSWGEEEGRKHPYLMLSITGVSRTRKSRCCWGFCGPFFTSPRGEGGGEKGGNRSPGSKTMCSSSCQ